VHTAIHVTLPPPVAFDGATVTIDRKAISRRADMLAGIDGAGANV
jgi:hypothetical protein